MATAAPRFAANDRASKQRMLYDGHRRKAGVAKANDSRRWRHLRRLANRWLSEIVESR